MLIGFETKFQESYNAKAKRTVNPAAPGTTVLIPGQCLQVQGIRRRGRHGNYTTKMLYALRIDLLPESGMNPGDKASYRYERMLL